MGRFLRHGVEAIQTGIPI